MSCAFCQPQVERELIVDRNELCLVIDLRHAILAGACIIVPKAHRESPFELSESEVSATFQLLRAAKQRLDSEFAPDGYNVGWNCGSVGGQEVAHVHLHVIPRFRDEPLAGKGIRFWLKQETNRRPTLRSHECPERGSRSWGNARSCWFHVCKSAQLYWRRHLTTSCAFG
jgi:diadenosine tetraphosphate (Ap4A) HIT family hydrolase